MASLIFMKVWLRNGFASCEVNVEIFQNLCGQFERYHFVEQNTIFGLEMCFICPEFEPFENLKW